MTDIAIRVDNLSKQYRIGAARARHDTLRDALTVRLRPNGHGGKPNTIWALKDVSFEVKQGEVVGVIGRNGAGKSTLLKILSRITEPTAGRAELYGRVGSLLEVGTGFHPELTGRENIYLNGAILGMKRREIAARFDEIVAFAEVEKFLDTPVKRYSSGMYVRLAFAVAAHLEPEILLVDEVLAVGDAEFQRKCLGKMGDVAYGGRTVMFVSHNLSAIRRLCRRSILLEAGEVVVFDPTPVVVERYAASDAYTARPLSWVDLARASRSGSGEARFLAVRFRDLSDGRGSELRSDQPAEFLLRISSDSRRTVGSIAVILFDRNGVKLVNADTISQARGVELRPGETIVRVIIDQLHLNSGVYTLGLWMASPTGGPFDYIEAATRLSVNDEERAGLGVRPANDGVVSCRFRVEELESG